MKVRIINIQFSLTGVLSMISVINVTSHERHLDGV